MEIKILLEMTPKQITMTPKEKAKELFNKYATYVVMWTGGVEVEKQNCKQCALIAVDEILEAVKNCVDREIAIPTIIYWEKVKQEIEKL